MWEIVVSRLPVTLLLMAYSIVLAVLIATPFALLSAMRRDRLPDYLVRIAFTAALGMPVFWSGIILALWLGAKLHLLPISGAGKGGFDTLLHLALPSLTIAIAISPILVRTLRSSLIEVLVSDYVATGRAMGLRRTFLTVNYILRNSLRPVITVISINVGYLIGGHCHRGTDLLAGRRRVATDRVHRHARLRDHPALHAVLRASRRCREPFGRRLLYMALDPRVALNS